MMKSRSILPAARNSRSKPLEAPKLDSYDPTDAEEEKLSQLARDHNFSDRDPSGAGDAQRAEEQSPRPTEAAPKVAHSAAETGAQDRPRSLIPARVQVVGPEAVSKDELKEQFNACLADGKPLPMPADLRSTAIPKHRFYQMMPVHVAAALEALTEANGYEKEWQLIAEMMKMLGAVDQKDS